MGHPLPDPLVHLHGPFIVQRLGHLLGQFSAYLLLDFVQGVQVVVHFLVGQVEQLKLLQCLRALLGHA